MANCLSVSGPQEVTYNGSYTYTVSLDDTDPAIQPPTHTSILYIYMNYVGGTLNQYHHFTAPEKIVLPIGEISVDFNLLMHAPDIPGQSFSIACATDIGVLNCTNFVIDLISSSTGGIPGDSNECSQFFFWTPYHHATKKTPNTGIIRHG